MHGSLAVLAVPRAAGVWEGKSPHVDVGMACCCCFHRSQPCCQIAGVGPWCFWCFWCPWCHLRRTITAGAKTSELRSTTSRPNSPSRPKRREGSPKSCRRLACSGHQGSCHGDPPSAAPRSRLQHLEHPYLQPQLLAGTPDSYSHHSLASVSGPHVPESPTHLPPDPLSSALLPLGLCSTL